MALANFGLLMAGPDPYQRIQQASAPWGAVGGVALGLQQAWKQNKAQELQKDYLEAWDLAQEEPDISTFKSPQEIERYNYLRSLVPAEIAGDDVAKFNRFASLLAPYDPDMSERLVKMGEERSQFEQQMNATKAQRDLELRKDAQIRAENAYDAVGSKIRQLQIDRSSLLQSGKTLDDVRPIDQKIEELNGIQAQQYNELGKLNPTMYPARQPAANVQSAEIGTAAPQEPKKDLLSIAQSAVDKKGKIDADKFKGLKGRIGEKGSEMDSAWEQAKTLSAQRREEEGQARQSEQMARQNRQDAISFTQQRAREWKATKIGAAYTDAVLNRQTLETDFKNLSSNDPAVRTAAAGRIVKTAGQLAESGVVNQGDVELMQGGQGLVALRNRIKGMLTGSTNIEVAKGAYRSAMDFLDGVSTLGKNDLSQSVANTNESLRSQGMPTIADESYFVTGYKKPLKKVAF